MLGQGMRAAIVGPVLLFLAALASPVHAQVNSGSIGGLIQDTSGAVLPGVTVEASSPALIEKVKSVVTDNQGVYKIVDLRPGSYSVTFALPGFSTVKRDGLELSAGFTAIVNVEMKLGAVEETINVSGASPLVDVQTATQHATVTRVLYDNLPISRSWFNQAIGLLPGAVGNQVDVGGTSDSRNASISYHGSVANETPMLFDGMSYAHVVDRNGSTAGYWLPNPGMVQEMSMDTAGTSAEATTSGLRLNVIPMSGGNKFSGSFLTNYTNDSLQSQAPTATGVVRNKTIEIFDINPSFGGPIKQDRAWFYASFRYFKTAQYSSGVYAGTTAGLRFTPDTSRPVTGPIFTRDSLTARVTVATSAKSRLAVMDDEGPHYSVENNQISVTTTPDAATFQRNPVERVSQVTWTSTLTNRLLFETGLNWRAENAFFDNMPQVAGGPSNNPGVPLSPVVETTTGITFRAPLVQSGYLNYNKVVNGQASLSYVTGSHSIKVGTQFISGSWILDTSINNDYQINARNGVPISATFQLPKAIENDVKLGLGTYAQDQWTLKRLTLNLGLRLDYINAEIPAQSIGPTTYAGARSFAPIADLPNWKDISPRLSIAYDLFGTGKTALKASLGRYVEGTATNIAAGVNPMQSNTTSVTTRAWTDANGDGIPQESELGPNSNANFGKSNLIPISYAPNTVDGWGRRGYNWESMVMVQHQLTTGVSAEAGYFRRSYFNQRAGRNVLVNPSDYSPFCVTSPLDARLPGGGGQQICGLADIDPAKFGLNNTVFELASAVSGQPVPQEVFDGLDINFRVRFPGTAMLTAGTSTGRTRISQCQVVNSPEDATFFVPPPSGSSSNSGGRFGTAPISYCDLDPLFMTSFKASGFVPLPWWGLQFSGAFKSVPGPQIDAFWSAPASAVSGLGRPLAGNAPTVVVPLIRSGSQYGQRLNQLDVRFVKNMRVARYQIQPQFDIYNLLNGDAVYSLNTTYGPAWQTPTGVLPGRIAKFGIQLNF